MMTFRDKDTNEMMTYRDKDIKEMMTYRDKDTMLHDNQIQILNSELVHEF